MGKFTEDRKATQEGLKKREMREKKQIARKEKENEII